jgi:hypothetical protein
LVAKQAAGVPNVLYSGFAHNYSQVMELLITLGEGVLILGFGAMLSFFVWLLMKRKKSFTSILTEHGYWMGWLGVILFSVLFALLKK